MRILFILSLCLIISCRSSKESISGNRIRANGFYYAENKESVPEGNPEAEKILKNKKTIYLLRFYDDSKAAMISETVSSEVNFKEDSTAKHYYKRIRELSRKDKNDKEFINFRYSAIKDSIRFEQKRPEITFIYSGKNYGDSLIIDQTFKQRQGASARMVAFHKKLKFSFRVVK